MCPQLGVNFTFHWGSPAATLDFTIPANKHSLIFCVCEEKADVLWIWPSLWTAGILFYHDMFPVLRRNIIALLLFHEVTKFIGIHHIAIQ